MPKLKMSDAEKKDRLAKATIEHNMTQYDVSTFDIARVMGKTERTVRNKINSPSSCNMDDLRLFIKMLKMTEAQIVELMGGTK